MCADLLDQHIPQDFTFFYVYTEPTVRHAAFDGSLSTQI